jgi:polygalacturonase
VLIEKCNVDTGDDAVVLKSGRGIAAANLERPTENVVIRDSTLVSSLYAGLAIGTELSGGIRNVRAENCIISGKQNGIIIKSREGRGATVENITGENLIVQSSPTFFCIDLLKKGIQASDPMTNAVDKWTLVRNVKFRNITVHAIANLVIATNTTAERMVENLTLDGIRGDCAHSMKLANLTNVVLRGIEVTGYTGAFITQTNVTGTGLDASK